MPEVPQSNRPPAQSSKHLIEQWVRDGSALAQAREAAYLPKCTHIVFYGVIQMQGNVEYIPTGMVVKNAVIEGFHPVLGVCPNQVFVWDQIILSGGAIVFPIDRAEAK